MIDKKTVIPGYYAVIPANVRYDDTLPANAKLLYGEITALCNKFGNCWASNSYFANLYGVSKVTISRWISLLEKSNHIRCKINYKGDTMKIENRIINIATPINNNVNIDEIVTNAINNNDNTPINKNDNINNNVNNGINKNINTPINKNVKENNTSINNTSINNIKREIYKEKSFEKILAEISDESLRDLFYEFIKMRKLIKAPMTERALKMLIDKVKDLEPDSVERQKKLLENAIVNNWKSVYPLKDEHKQQKQENGTGNMFIDMLIERGENVDI